MEAPPQSPPQSTPGSAVGTPLSVASSGWRSVEDAAARASEALTPELQHAPLEAPRTGPRGSPVRATHSNALFDDPDSSPAFGVKFGTEVSARPGAARAALFAGPRGGACSAQHAPSHAHKELSTPHTLYATRMKQGAEASGGGMLWVVLTRGRRSCEAAFARGRKRKGASVPQRSAAAAGLRVCAAGVVAGSEYSLRLVNVSPCRRTQERAQRPDTRPFFSARLSRAVGQAGGRRGG